MLSFFRNCLLASLVVVPSAVLGQDRDGSVATAASTNSQDEAQIRANVNDFVKAYNAGDAKAIASLFVPDAQVIDEDGKTARGRDAIEKVFAAIFADSPKGRIHVNVDSLRFIGSALAIETGHAKVNSNPDENPDETRYTAVHIKLRDGKWQMGFVRDTPNTELTSYERLKPLEWLIGNWVDESPESIVTTSCTWSDNRNFILQDVHVHMRGRDAMHLTQRIGWDPLTRQIKAWTFDSRGGYGEAFWTRDGDRWVAKTTAVRHDGTTASMTNVFTPIGKDAYRWRSTDRIVGGEVLPPMEVKVVRKAPEAALTK